MSTIIHIPARFIKPMPDPRDPPVEDTYPTPTDIERAKAACLCERADALEAVPDGEQLMLLKGMDRPDLKTIQWEESIKAESVAIEIGHMLYDQPLKLLPLDVRTRARQAGAVACRSMHQAWRSKAQNSAAESVLAGLLEDVAPSLPHLTRAHWWGLAVRLSALALATERDVYLTSEDDHAMPPGQYLKVAGLALKEDAELKRQMEDSDE